MFPALKLSCICFNLNQTSGAIALFYTSHQCFPNVTSASKLDLGYANAANSNCSVSRFVFIRMGTKPPPPFSNHPLGA